MPTYTGSLPQINAYNPGSRFNITSGMPRRNSGVGRHDGIDYGASAGTPVRSASDGVIKVTYDSDGFGMSVDVTSTRADGSKFKVRYGHVVPSSDLYDGKVVSAGDQIGTVGSVAQLTSMGGTLGPDFSGPHLHLEITSEDFVGQGLRGQVDPLSFTAWGGVSHMIGTTPDGNLLISKETVNVQTGNVDRDIRTRSPDSSEVLGIVSSQIPIQDYREVLDRTVTAQGDISTRYSQERKGSGLES